MQISGKPVIVLIFASAFLAAAFSWSFRWQATHRTAQFWGADAIAILQRPKEIVALELGESPPIKTETAGKPERFYGHNVVARRIITTEGGITHLRQALLEDRSYDWNTEIADVGAARFCLRFQSNADGSEIVLFFPSDFTWMRRTDIADDDKNVAIEPLPDRSVSTTPIAKGLQTYFEDVFGDSSPQEPASTL